ncbi:tetratricopeptide repeat protein 5-like isoform X3 [Cucumis melo var. makuwa]|uniref:Tetratricopeptide repeat protein 5-like isoform X3 n=1 Tax=Cucumis melo var. makuwa TaxID=1194695 RepID=A0A5A7SZG5_CUCMM|nr:tetratricopeptide repeat protein 5-like isoform X3 [Cucumis melo var. makuwa]
MCSEAKEDTFDKATAAVEELYLIRDTFFPVNPDDKTSKLRELSDLALKILDSIPPEQRKSPLQRAMYEYLRGKMLDVFPEYRKEAEDHLSKAVKLNPSLADAWLCLGNCIWKKGDLSSAKNCFTLALNKRPEKKLLCQLSMLERKMAQGKCTENEAKLVEESIQHAKEAVTLDVKDGNSWYNLGNACLTSFFVTGAWDHSKLLQSLKAYQNAEKDEKMLSNPDLYFNCATVNKYLENYYRALSGFEAAALKDPSLSATREVHKMVTLLDKLDNMLKAHAKSRKGASSPSSVDAISSNFSYKRTTIDHLSEGLNKTVAVTGKVLFFIKHDSLAPLYYLACDSNQTCFVLSLYGMRNDTIAYPLMHAIPCTVVVLHSPPRLRKEIRLPYWNHIIATLIFHGRESLNMSNQHYQFNSIRVDFLEQVIVNGKAPSAHQAVRASIYAQHKP